MSRLPHRRLAASVVGLVAAASLVACGEDDKPDDELRAAIRATERLAFKYAYEEQADGRDVVVRGLVEDDFRYQAQVAIDGRPAYEEIVSDDAVAARLLDPASLGVFVKEELAGQTAEEFETGATALQKQQWVVDPTGAPSLLRSGTKERLVGDDWIIDSLTVFDHIEQAMRGQFTVRFNREALEYRAQEDPHPHPADGVIRYDLLPNDLPRRSDVTGGNQATLGVTHFRKLSVYVNDGVITEVRETIDIANRLDDIERNFDVDFPKDRSVRENVGVAVEAINTVRTGQGEDPLRMRTMRLRLTDLGDEVNVAIPTGDTVEATLAFLRNRGFGADAAPTEGTAGEATGQASGDASGDAGDASGGADDAGGSTAP